MNDLTPYELAQMHRETMELAAELRVGFEMLNQPLTQLTELLRPVQPVSQRPSDRVVTQAIRKVAVVGSGLPSPDAQGFYEPVVIPASLDRIRLQMIATPAIIIGDGQPLILGTVMLSAKPFVTTPTYPLAVTLTAPQLLDGVPIGAGFQGASAANVFTSAAPWLHVDTRQDLYVRAVTFDTSASVVSAILLWQVQLIAEYQDPQPSDQVARKALGLTDCGC